MFSRRAKGRLCCSNGALHHWERESRDPVYYYYSSMKGSRTGVQHSSASEARQTRLTLSREEAEAQLE